MRIQSPLFLTLLVCLITSPVFASSQATARFESAMPNDPAIMQFKVAKRQNNPYSPRTNPLFETRLNNTLRTSYDDGTPLTTDALIENYLMLLPIAHLMSLQAAASLKISLVTFLDSECQRTRASRLSATNAETIETGYKNILTFVQNISSTVSEDTLRQKLMCYEVTFLLGLANCLGFQHKNSEQLTVAQQALTLTQSFSTDLILNAYPDGSNFNKHIVTNVCVNIIRRAKRYISIDKD